MEQEIKMLKGTVKKLQKSLSTYEKLFEQLDSRVDKKLEVLKKKIKEKDNQIKELEKNSKKLIPVLQHQISVFEFYFFLKRIKLQNKLTNKDAIKPSNKIT